MVVRNFNLPEDLFTRFKVVCVCENTSMSNKVANLIEDYLKESDRAGLKIPEINTKNDSVDIEEF